MLKSSSGAEPNDKKRILIVGASRGLGLGLAAEFAARGYAVTATVRDDAGAARVAALPHANAISTDRLDVRDDAAVRAFAARHADTAFDVVFLNAGVSGPEHQSALKATPEQFADLLTTNALAPIKIARLLMGQLVPQRGVLAFMSSQLGSVAQNEDGFAPLYRASKAALNSMARSLFPKLQPLGVSLLVLHPGWVNTDMGGPNAPVTVPESVAGLADVVAQHLGRGTQEYLNYKGETIPW